MQAALRVQTAPLPHPLACCGDDRDHRQFTHVTWDVPVMTGAVSWCAEHLDRVSPCLHHIARKCIGRVVGRSQQNIQAIRRKVGDSNVIVQFVRSEFMASETDALTRNQCVGHVHCTARIWTTTVGSLTRVIRAVEGDLRRSIEREILPRTRRGLFYGGDEPQWATSASSSSSSHCDSDRTNDDSDAPSDEDWFADEFRQQEAGRKRGRGSASQELPEFFSLAPPATAHAHEQPCSHRAMAACPPPSCESLSVEEIVKLLPIDLY